MELTKNVPLLMNLIYAGFNRGLPGGDLAPRIDGTTFCNLFVQSVCKGLGYDGFTDLTANQIFDKLATSADWISIGDDVAQSHANNGALVIAAYKNPQGHGHVNVVVPGILELSNTAGKRIPKCANVGKEVFIGKRLSQAFAYPTHAPTLFVLKAMV